MSRYRVALALVLITLAAPSVTEAQNKRYVWAGHGRSPQHDGLADVGAQALGQVRWQTPVDLAPQYVGTLPAHPLRLAARDPKNTIVVPVKTGATGGFRVDGRTASTAPLLWTHPTDYVLPPHNWTPSFAPAIGKNKLWIPARRRHARVADAHRRDHQRAHRPHRVLRRRQLRRESGRVRRDRLHQYPAHGRQARQRLLRLPGDRRRTRARSRAASRACRTAASARG